MTAANGKLRVFPPLEGDRLLGLGDGGRGPHHHPEYHAVPRGDAPQDAAAVVPLGNHPARLHAEGVVGLAAPQGRKAEPRPEGNALHRGNAEHQLGEHALHAVEKGRAQPRGRPSIRHSSTPPTLSCSARAARMAASSAGPAPAQGGQGEGGQGLSGVSPGSTGSRKLLSRMFSSCWIWHTAEMPCPARYCRHRAPANTRGAVSRALKCPPPRKSSKP